MPIKLRCGLFTPATRADRFPKAMEVGADLLFIDLEDSVAPADKVTAREHALKALSTTGSQRTASALRINSIKTKTGLADLMALVEGNARPDALLLPKTESAAELSLVAAVLRQSNIGTRLIPLIESAKALQSISEIAEATDRTIALMLGAADLAADLGCGLDALNINSARVSMVRACAIAGLAALDSPFFDFRDAEGLTREAEQAKKMGFAGKAAIHPSQVAVINGIFTPTQEEVARARKVLEVNERGVGSIDGQMIDEALARQARRVIATADEDACPIRRPTRAHDDGRRDSRDAGLDERMIHRLPSVTCACAGAVHREHYGRSLTSFGSHPFQSHERTAALTDWLTDTRTEVAHDPSWGRLSSRRQDRAALDQ